MGEFSPRKHPYPMGDFEPGNILSSGVDRSMIDLQPLIDFVKLTIYTAYIDNVPKPNSVLIIAKPESGKTEALKKFIPNKNVAYLSDVTAYGIERDYLTKIESREIRHIIIPDLLKPLSRKESTVKTFVTMMNALIEEGIASASTYALRRTSEMHVKCGLITAITDGEFNDKRHGWSRLVPVSHRAFQLQLRNGQRKASLRLNTRPRLLEGIRH
jgi:hypothetical protein